MLNAECNVDGVGWLRPVNAVGKIAEATHARGGHRPFRIVSLTRGSADVNPAHPSVSHQ
jgi:hypothetical protein